MLNFDFTQARTKHREWRAKLDAFLLSGKGLTLAQLTSERECDLGKWLYGDGLKKYGAIPDMHKLEACHKSLHASVRAAVQAKDAKNNAGAQAEYKKVCQYSEEIIKLLNSVEATVKKATPAAK